MKQLLTFLLLAVGFAALAQTQPANVCTSKIIYNYDEEITWYYDLTGNTSVSPGDELFFYSWAPSHSGGSLPLEYVSDMIWKLTWTPTVYYATDKATLDAGADGIMWHNLTRTGNVAVTGTVDYAIKEKLRKGGGCNCILPASSNKKFLVNFTNSNAEIGGQDSDGNYWTNVTATNTSYDPISVDNTGYYKIATSGGFTPNDNSNFTTPAKSKLGELAQANATKSYLFLSGAATGTVTLSCLEPKHTYKLSILGSRATATTRETRYTVTGSTSKTGVIQTSGSSLGSSDCTDCNDDELYIAEVSPNSNGEISILVEIVSGGFGYINAMMIQESLPVITWSGGTWSNTSGPSTSDDVLIDDDYVTATNGNLEMANLTVNAGKTLTVSGGNTLNIRGNLQNNGSIMVESGASLLTYNGNTFSGNTITIKRNTRYADGKYSFVGSPVMQSSAITGASLGSWVYAYDESVAFGTDGLSRWVDASASVLTTGKGYAQAGQQEISFTGTPNTGNITVSGSYTNRTDANDGWNLVANPYAAAIDFTALMADNTNNTGSVYIWDDNGSDAQRGDNSDYIVINASGNTNSKAGNVSRYNGHLGSAQAFFIKLDGNGNNNIVFEEDQRVQASNSDNNFFRKSEVTQRLRVNLLHEEGLFKQTLLAWNKDVDDVSINRLYDAPLFNPAAENAIYSTKLDHALAIQTLSSTQTAISLGVNIGEEGTYTMEFEVDEFNDDMYLIDRFMKKTVNIRNGAYTFDATKGLLNDRFQLVSAMSLHTVENIVKEWNIYAVGQTIHIQPMSQKSSEFKIMSISGQFITGLEVSESVQIQLNEKPGVFIVTNGSYSQKVILK